MAAEITMPRLSDSMEEGAVAKWYVEVGATVERGQLLAEIDTDKATMDYEAEAAGTVLAILVGEGESAPIGATIAWIGAPGEEVPAAADSAPLAAAPTQAPPAPAPGRAAGGRANASPVARRLAAELGVDLGSIEGTGPGGQVTKEDVQRAASAVPAQPAAPSAKGEVRLEELSKLQRVVARRMTEGSAAPDFAVEVEIDMTEVVALRAELAAGATPHRPSTTSSSRRRRSPSATSRA